jgi:hypothetical protein
MTVSYLDYAVENGYIHNWLVAGPHAILVADLDRYTGADYKLQIARYYYERGAGIVETPAETQPIAIGDFNGKWEYVASPSITYLKTIGWALRTPSSRHLRSTNMIFRMAGLLRARSRAITPSPPRAG